MSRCTSSDLLRSALAALGREEIAYCVLRDGDRLHQLHPSDEVDLLVEEQQFPRVCRVLSHLGFVHVPARGHAPHQFFIAYLKDCHGWLKLDLVTRVAFGVPSHAVETALAENCLGRRRLCGHAYLPSPEDEWIVLLLHCVLDKASFAPHRRQRLRELGRRVSNEEYLGELLRQYWDPGADWPTMVQRMDAENWEAFLSESQAVSNRLESNQRLRVGWRRIRDAALRKWDRAAAMLRPRSPSVAILAPDGAGKSTLVAALQKSFFCSTRAIYMGLYPKHDGPRRPTLPGMGLLRCLLTQWARCIAGRYHQGRGRLVLYDRYSYDALLPTARHRGWMSRLRRQVLSRACPAPDVILVLDAPGAMLFSRKREHSPDRLEQQRRGYLALRTRFAGTAVLDATAPAEEVCAEATSLIWRAYAARLARRAVP